MNQTDRGSEGGNQNGTGSNGAVRAVDRTSVNDLWLAIWRRKILVFIITAAFLLLSSVWAYLQTPIYRSDVLMNYVEHGDSGGTGLTSLMSQYAGAASLAGLNLQSQGDGKNEAIATLLSRSFTMQFIDEMNIMPDLFPEDDFEKDLDRETAPTRNDAFEIFDDEIRIVAEDKKTGLITLSIETDDRVLAAEWANSMVSLLNSSLRQRAIDESQQSIDFLTRELEKTSPEELRQSIYSLIEGHIANIMLANVHEQYAFKVIDPAVVADEDAFERPKRLLILLSGAIVGLLLGLFIACASAFSLYNPRRTSRAGS